MSYPNDAFQSQYPHEPEPLPSAPPLYSIPNGASQHMENYGYSNPAHNPNFPNPDISAPPLPFQQPYAPSISYPPIIPWKPDKANKYNGEDIPNKDVGENDAEEGPAAVSPLPYSTTICGYENVSHAAGPLIKPPVAASEDGYCYKPPIIDSQRFPNITDEDARRALLELAEANCCWGTKPAKKMEIKDIIASSAYHYIMESFTEGRKASVTYKPYEGGEVDSPYSGTATLPWDIRCDPKSAFTNDTYDIQVPHTEIVTACHLCGTRGYIRCGKCRGRGKVRCGTCNGTGKIEKEGENGEKEAAVCNSCGGKKRKDCCKCKRLGCVVCSSCKGYRNITQYIRVTVIYSHRKDDHILERSDLPNELIRDVTGDILFEQTANVVQPIVNFFEGEINSASQRLITSHKTSWPAERILQQKHCLRAVPVHTCHFEYKDQPGRFWVYGNQKYVHTCDYPHTCCCCRCSCAIL